MPQEDAHTLPQAQLREKPVFRAILRVSFGFFRNRRGILKERD